MKTKTTMGKYLKKGRTKKRGEIDDLIEMKKWRKHFIRLLEDVEEILNCKGVKRKREEKKEELTEKEIEMQIGTII